MSGLSGIRHQCGCAAIGLAYPDNINDGIEDGVDSTGAAETFGNYDNCATEQGNLPWVTLGTPEFDAWNNHFFYRVTDDFADDIDGAAAADGTPCPNPAVNVSFCITSTGDIDIQNVSGSTIATDIPAIVISFGSNGSQTPTTASEMENQDTNLIYISNDFIGASGSEFNDLVMWISPNLLMTRMIISGRLP